MNDIPQMQTCACGDGCEDRASVKWRGYFVVDCVPNQEAGRLLAAITEGMADALAEERAAVVAFLREGDTVCMQCGDRATLDLAYRIECGEHRREEEA